MSRKEDRLNVGRGLTRVRFPQTNSMCLCTNWLSAFPLWLLKVSVEEHGFQTSAHSWKM